MVLTRVGSLLRKSVGWGGPVSGPLVQDWFSMLLFLLLLFFADNVNLGAILRIFRVLFAHQPSLGSHPPRWSSGFPPSDVNPGRHKPSGSSRKIHLVSLEWSGLITFPPVGSHGEWSPHWDPFNRSE